MVRSITRDAGERDAWRADLARRGFLHPERSLYNMQAICRALDPADPQSLVDEAAATRDPDLALNGLERLISLVTDPARLGLLLRPRILARCLLLGGSSEPLVEGVVPFLEELDDPGFAILPEGGPLPFEGDDPAELRLWHRREMTRICVAEMEERIGVEETALALSQLADRTVQAALRIESGDTPPLAVIALGKWGGMELNYSSDIDFLFIRGDDVEEQVAERVARRVLRILEGHAGGGHLYRTDLRLRPGGPTGALVPTLSGARHELRSTAGTWERLVFIRVHVAAGDPAPARTLLEELEEFVYESPFHLEEIRQVKGYKDLLEKSRPAVEAADRELKVGWGGIRDVEYVVQFLQLLHGAIYSSIRGGNVFRAIRGLANVGALTTTERAFLLRGYRFLRRVEHHLMLRHRRQSFLLPEAEDARRALAKASGFEEWESFRAEFDRYRNSIRDIFDRLFHRLFTSDAEEAVREVNVLLAFRPEKAEIERVFAPLHFRDPQKAYQLLRRLAYPRRKSLQAPRARHFLASLFPELLARLRECPDPDQAVLMFTNCLETLGAPATFYQLLAENPENCRLFVDLFGSSRFLSDLLLDHPSILDELIDRLRTGEKIEEGALVGELRQTMEGCDPRLRSKVLHEFRALHLLEVAVLDLSTRVPLVGILSRLSDIARALLKVIDEQILADTVRRLGELVPTVPGKPPRHTILALGRLGGSEMGYASDIDLILIYDGEGKTSHGIAERELYTQHLQNVISTLGNPGTGGPLYSVDLRLRPHGDGGALVHSFRKFRAYVTGDDSQVWEHQALVRCSVAAGDESLGEEVLGFIRAHLGRGLDAETILEDMKSMHARRGSEAVRARDGLRIKSGPGGIFDIEFLVQSAILLGHGQEEDLWEPNTHTAIHLLGRRGHFTGAETAALATAYSFFRLVENRMSMLHRASVRVVPLDDSSLRDLALRIGYRPPPGVAPERYLLEEIQYHTRQVRKIFEEHC